jgi:Tol biopolymer transport system component
MVGARDGEEAACMTSERWHQVSAIYHEALNRPLAERTAFVHAACARDEQLRDEIIGLLRHDSDGVLVDEPALAVAARGIAASGQHTLVGRRIGPYQVVARLGAGGMGEVYRAHDTRLDRAVAIKVLPQFATGELERLARFEREARILAALNHPHIGAIYGVESVDDQPALVLELIEGETLAERLARSHLGLPVTEALAIAGQVAQALEAAHERGIIHRDLTPANVAIRPDGTVKVLDFGLAKAIAIQHLDANDATANVDRVTATQAGAIVGTSLYMSPEQARGLPVDERTDIWAFGCLLYEMLVGRAAFASPTPSDTLAAVLHSEPDWSRLPAEIDGATQATLRRCLEKDPKQRVRDIGDVQLGMKGGFMPPAAVTTGRRWWTGRLALLGVGLVMGGLAVGMASKFFRTDQSQPVTRLLLTARDAAGMWRSADDTELAITPDGARVVYFAQGGKQILTRALNDLEPAVLVRGAELRSLSVSPDGRWLAFVETEGSTDAFGDFVLKKVPITGGPSLTIGRINGIPRGLAWLRDNTIVFTTNSAAGLLRISADGGVPSSLTTPNSANNEIAYFRPKPLSDGHSVLYTVVARSRSHAVSEIAMYDLRTHTSKLLLSSGADAQEVAGGYLVYAADGGLSAVRYDPNRQEVSGSPVSVLPRLVTTSLGIGAFSVATNGTLVYADAPDGFVTGGHSLVWVDRDGNEEPVGAPTLSYIQPRLSHDGSRIAAAVTVGVDLNVWVWDLTRRVLTRVTTEGPRDVLPLWTLDDRWLVFGSIRGETIGNLWRQRADGTGPAERLTDNPRIHDAPTGITPDGKHLIFQRRSEGTDWDIVQLSLDDSHSRETLVNTRFAEGNAVVSPNGHWLAYQSSASGRWEVYVQPYPGLTGSRWQVSSTGGSEPTWTRDGRELVFLAANDRLMSVAVKADGATWAATLPTTVVQQPYYTARNIGRQYDISADGKRFLMIKVQPAKDQSPDIVVAQHWDQELRARLPGR